VTVTVSSRLAAQVAALRHEELPRPVAARAKLFMIDTLAVAWTSSAAPSYGKVHPMFTDECRFPNHMNITLQADTARTGIELGLRPGAVLQVHPGTCNELAR